MTRMSIVLLTWLTMCGCTLTDGASDRDPRYYTRSDIDAITAGIECRQLARTLVQISRCDTVRR